MPEPWGHLTNQLDTYRRKLRDACPDDETFSILWSTYSTLNRLTAAELVELVTSCGFAILRQQTTSDGPDPPRALLHAYDHAALTTDQVVLLAARNDVPAALTRPPAEPRVQGPSRQAHAASSQADHANGKTVVGKPHASRRKAAIVEPQCSPITIGAYPRVSERRSIGFTFVVAVPTRSPACSPAGGRRKGLGLATALRSQGRDSGQMRTELRRRRGQRCRPLGMDEGLGGAADAAVHLAEFEM